MIAAAALVAFPSACRDAHGPRARIHTARGAVEVTLEVADRPETMQRGLMYRTSLADDHGMLFVFSTDSDHQFWMKNTLIPLDMIFIASDQRIAGIRANTTPMSTASIGVGQPTRWVLEVPGGYAARRGIAPGDQIELLEISSR